MSKGKLYDFDCNRDRINNFIYNETEFANTSTPPSQDKLKATSNFSWFNENGNTYFKAKDNYYVKSGWNIEVNIYVFGKNGMIQKCEYQEPIGHILFYDPYPL